VGCSWESEARRTFSSWKTSTHCNATLNGCDMLIIAQELPRLHDSNMAPSSNLQSTYHRLRSKHDINLFQGGTAGDRRRYNHI
jgi:hypothetical protein